MKIQKIKEALQAISNSIDQGYFLEALQGCNLALPQVEKLNKDIEYYDLLLNLAGLYIDIGGWGGITKASIKGLELLEFNQEKFMKINSVNFLYSLANAKSNFLEQNNKLLAVNFSNVKDFVEIKNIYWQAIKSCKEKQVLVPLEYIVNLANSLKQQYRFVEALKYYDEVSQLNKDIPQAWINRSELLIMINHVTDSLSIRMLKEVKHGYDKAVASEMVPPTWKPYYAGQSINVQKQIDEIALSNHLDELDVEDVLETQKEYEQHSDYRKWCLDKYLSLSEHALYCKCIEGDRDNITILSNIVGSELVASMEMVLNRLKSEFSFARHLYYESLSQPASFIIDRESCFSELMNDEVLGLGVERLRTSFRICFGILDKISVALCDLLNIPKQRINFLNIWSQIPEKIKSSEVDQNYGLLALYSIATDLNVQKGKEGEFSFYKKWRNALEHDFIVVHKGAAPSDVYGSYNGFTNDITLVSESEFLDGLLHVLQLTRSAIFSFVYAVRLHIKKDQPNKSEILGTVFINRKDFESEDRI